LASRETWDWESPVRAAITVCDKPPSRNARKTIDQSPRARASRTSGLSLMVVMAVPVPFRGVQWRPGLTAESPWTVQR
jgi:hypothetical protein